MRLAVFTSQFPGRTATFFARDIRGLIDAGIDVEVFPIYPLDSSLWKYVPELLNEKVLPPSKVHHLSMRDCIRGFYAWPPKKLTQFLADTFSISASALQYGLQPLAKSSYVFLKAWAWAQMYPNNYDRVLAYWGNYPATCAYLYHRLSGVSNPFSLFLHANVDLYRRPIFMKCKMLYADQIITCSEFNRNFIAERFSDVQEVIKEKIFVHHHGLDFGTVPMGLDDRTPGTIIAVGRFVEQKGFDYLLRAVGLLKTRGVNVTVDLVGDGEQAELLRSLAHDLDIVDQIRFRGWLPADQVPAAISQAMLLVHPSPDLGDGVPNVIKESMAVGTTVLGSTVAGIPELLGNGKRGVLVPPKNVTALADAIESLLTDEGRRISYARQARNYAEQSFDMWKNGQRLAEVFKSHCKLTESLSLTDREPPAESVTELAGYHPRSH